MKVKRFSIILVSAAVAAIAILMFLEFRGQSQPDQQDALQQMFPGFEAEQIDGWVVTYDNGFRDGPGRYVVEATARNAKHKTSQWRECLFRWTEKGWLVDRTRPPCGELF